VFGIHHLAANTSIRLSIKLQASRFLILHPFLSVRDLYHSWDSVAIKDRSLLLLKAGMPKQLAKLPVQPKNGDFVMFSETALLRDGQNPNRHWCRGVR
jgi:hypothetical protein